MSEEQPADSSNPIVVSKIDDADQNVAGSAIKVSNAPVMDSLSSTPAHSSPSPSKKLRLSSPHPIDSATSVAKPTESSSLPIASSSATTHPVTLSQDSEPVDEMASSSQGAEIELDDQDNLEEIEDDEPEYDDEYEEETASTVLGDDDTESVVSQLISSSLEQEREARKVEDRKLLALLAHFDEEQLNRFEAFRRATFAKASVRRLIQAIASCAVSQNVVIAMAGLTKVFVGEIVEEALDYKERLGETGPLKPKHIREAYRILNEQSALSLKPRRNPLK